MVGWRPKCQFFWGSDAESGESRFDEGEEEEQSEDGEDYPRPGHDRDGRPHDSDEDRDHGGGAGDRRGESRMRCCVVIAMDECS